METTPDPPVRETIPYATPRPRRSGGRILLLVMGAVLVVVMAGAVAYLVVAGGRVQVATAVAARAAARAVAAREAMPEKEVEVTVVQRASRAIPGSEGRVVVKLGDVTGGQALVSVERLDGEALLAMRSLKEGESARFSVAAGEYELKAKELRNFLTGDDFGVFTITPVRLVQLSEAQKIERLIQYVAGLEGATFIRNGDEHTPAAAAEHMRTKLEMAGEDVKTAKEFIEGAATKSSISGRPYKVRMKDGREVEAGTLLLEELRRLEQAPASQPAQKQVSPTRSGGA